MSIRPPFPLGCNSSRILFSKLTPTCTRHIPQMRLQHTPNAFAAYPKCTATDCMAGRIRTRQTAANRVGEHIRTRQTAADCAGGTFEHGRLLQTARGDTFERDRLLQTAIITLSGSTPKVFALLSSRTASQESVLAEGSFGSPSDGFWLDTNGTVHKAFLKSMQFLRGCFKIDAPSPQLARRAQLAWRLS